MQKSDSSPDHATVELVDPQVWGGECDEQIETRIEILQERQTSPDDDSAQGEANKVNFFDKVAIDEEGFDFLSCDFAKLLKSLHRPAWNAAENQEMGAGEAANEGLYAVHVVLISIETMGQHK